MRASLPEVYAAGDVCAVHWEPQPQLWFQVGEGAVPIATCWSMGCMVYVSHCADEAVDPGQADGGARCKGHGGAHTYVMLCATAMWCPDSSLPHPTRREGGGDDGLLF